jgi:hypothetical protein
MQPTFARTLTRRSTAFTESAHPQGIALALAAALTEAQQKTFEQMTLRHMMGGSRRR